MALLTVRCPHCGASLEIREDEPAACSYCGNRVRAQRDASGQPVASMEGLRADTGILAREAAIRRLEERQRALERERDRLLGHQQEAQQKADEQVRAGRSSAGCLRWIAAACLVVALMAAGSGMLPLAAPALLAGVLLLVLAASEAHRGAAKAEIALDAYRRSHAERLVGLDRELQRVRGRIAALKEEIDQLTDRL